tara:strand:+ start:586 stop:1392 length:807 start_codon:yes stop_codon:yes gene_type:complete
MSKSKKNILNSEILKKGILRLTLNNPENKNALSTQMMDSLISAIKNASVNNEVRVIVIASKGDTFCSGHDLKEIQEITEDEEHKELNLHNLFNLCSSLMQLIVQSPKPVIAEVAGIATAAGCQLVASCDLAISSESAKFATPGVNIGLFCSTPMVALSRNISKKNSMKMLLTGDMISADEAKRISLINDCVPDDQLTKSVLDLAKKISEKSQAVLKIGKEAFYKQSQLNIEDAYEYTSMVMTKNMMIDDASEGISSFLDKRVPKWKNK